MTKTISCTNLRELLEQPDTPQAYLLRDILARGEFAGIVGKSGANKSTLLRSLCLAIATKQPTFCGFPLQPIYGRALYVFSEDGLPWVRHFLKKNTEGMEHTIEQLENFRLVNMNDFEDPESLIKWFRDELTAQKYDLIALDSFSDLLNILGADVNKNNEVRKAIRKLNFLKADGCCPIFNHHVSDKVKDIGTFQGATSFKQIVRTMIEITEKGKQRVISVEKNSYGEKPEPMVFDLSDNFLFEFTGETMTRSELSEHLANSNFSAPKAPNRPKVAPCDLDTVTMIFGDSDTLQTGEIVRRLQLKYTISERTAKTWIADISKLGHIEKSSHGVYELTKVQSATTYTDSNCTTSCTMPQSTENKEVENVQEIKMQFPENAFCTMGKDKQKGGILQGVEDDLPPRWKHFEQFEGAKL